MKHALHITPEVLAAAYTFLRSTKPFSRWKLPPAELVKFKVTNSTSDAGYCKGLDEIGVSRACSAHTASMLATMSHEMIHLHLNSKGVRSHHGAEFQKASSQVSREHGWDMKRFF
jgi:predicted SprT family Zn-dependent metalloprotease